MARINVFLKDDLLAAIDAETRKVGGNRSAFIQAALRNYLDLQTKMREEAEAQRRMDEACRKMDALATKLGPWDPVKVIRGFRNTRYRAPRRAPAQVRERRRG